MVRLVRLLALSLLLSSCGVKEDRQDCPCWLRLVPDPCRTIADDVMISAWSDDLTDRYFRDSVHIPDHPEYYEHEVPRGQVRLCVYAGVSENVDEGGRITIPYGQEFDKVHAYIGSLPCKDEFCRDTIRLSKQFATVFVRVRKSGEENYPYIYNLESDVAGLDLLTLQPLPGEFRHEITFNDRNVGSVDLPRHAEDGGGLVLNIVHKGVAVERIDLSGMLKAVNYDWTSEDLEDIHVEVDYEDTSVSLSISGWKEGEKQEIVL